MGFSIRLAPGIRVSASSRGLRTSLGPRVARVHVGAGRTGVSTGAGPVGFYTSLGGSSRSGSSGRSPSGLSPAASVRNLQAAAKLQQARELLDAINAIRSLHRQVFPPARRPLAPRGPVPSRDQLQRSVREYALKRVSVFKRAERAEAKAWADSEAFAEHERLSAAADAEQARVQTQLDNLWAKLLANDPDVVISTLADAFEDNEAPAAPVGVSGGVVSLVVLVPDVSVLPDRMPLMTDAGNVSLRKTTKTQVSALYLALVCGHVLVTVKEAFAVSAGIRSAKVVVLRHRGVDTYGRPRVECILATHIRRQALDGIRWESSDAPTVINDAADDTLLKIKGSAKELMAIELIDEPEIAAVVAAVDVNQLLGRP